jgi:membrane-associated phospholipid phosphatase
MTILERLHWRARLKLCLPAYALWVVSYELVGRYAMRLVPHELATPLDAMLPFWPQWVWVYALTYVVPFVAVLAIRDDRNVRRALLAVTLASAAAYLVYLVFPVASPRPHLGASVSERALGLIHLLDVPANQLPSLHVANAIILYAAVTRDRPVRWLRVLMFMLAAGIALSTLFVKQHLVLDVVLGLIWGLTAERTAGWLHQLSFGAPSPSEVP